MIRLKVPQSLLNDISYSNLYGHYGRPLPVDAPSLRIEAIERGKDVITLVTAIKNKNQEMSAIRKHEEA